MTETSHLSPEKTHLGLLDIELTDSVGSFIIDPNRAVVIAITSCLPLYGEVGTSDISGLPGFGYRTNQIELCLTGPELLRFLQRNLRPEEVRAIMDKYGDFYEIHEDFYCPETLEALQPVETHEVIK